MAPTQDSVASPERLEQLLTLRERLNREAKVGKGKKGGTTGEQQPLLDYGEAFSLILSFASSPSTTVASAVAKSATKGPVPTTAAFEALDLLLRRCLLILAPPPSSPSPFASQLPTVRSQFTPDFVSDLANTLYATWDTHLPSAQQKLRSSLVLLLSLASPAILDYPQLIQQLKEKILVDRWDSKRALQTFDALLPHAKVDEFAAFSVAGEAAGDAAEDVVRRFIHGIVANEEMAQLSGKVAFAWIEKVWAEQKQKQGTGAEEGEHLFWIRPSLEACRSGGPKARHSISTYVLQSVFARRKDAFRAVLKVGGYLFEEDAGEEGYDELAEDDLETALAILKAGNTLSLVELDSPAPTAPSTSSTPSPPSQKVALPTSLLRTCLSHSSTSLRTSALALLVLSPSNSTPFPLITFPLLRQFYAYSLGEEDGEMRMVVVSHTGKLLLRLRDSAWKAYRTANKKGKEDTEVAKKARTYVQHVEEWLNWWLDLVGNVNLNPAKPYRIKINSLRMLDLAFQAKVDARYQLEGAAAAGDEASAGPRNATTGYSSYRKTAQTQTPMFHARHRQFEQDKTAEGVAPFLPSSSSPSSVSPSTTAEPSRSSSPAPTAAPADESGWPFTISLVNPLTTQVLLRQLLSTYTALRYLALSILEKFPAPLPGYSSSNDGEGLEKAKKELLLPALRMIRSGREAEASAGAGVIGLLWRKWVLESVERGEQEGERRWTLGEVGRWQEGVQTKTGPAGFAFISSLLDLIEQQLSHYSANLADASGSSPMHGTLLALRHLFISIPTSSYAILSSPEDRRRLFHRALRVIRQVWEVTSPVLAAKAPEGGQAEGEEEEEADTEEARAIRFEKAQKAAAAGEDDADDVAADGNGGPQHKIILSACWRAMKEAGELLETILRLPSELGSEAFQEVWHYDEIREIGELFGVWLARIRHRGAFMGVHPCYTRAAAALLVAGREWPEVGKFPEQWLDSHLDAIVSKRISFTRRSAGIPYLILGLLLTILPSSRTAFDRSFTRLFEVAESTSREINDESRVHAMNTIRTVFLDAKGGQAAAAYVERGFLLAISLFFSTNWILRNVAMMLFASLTTRALNARRTNLDREDPVALAKRLSIDEFFGRYPALREVLRGELERGWRETRDDAPSSNLQSSLFSILMLLSLLQTPKRTSSSSSTDTSLSAPFIPLVKTCASSRVWKIREIAGDALTGLVAVDEVAEVSVKLLRGVKEELSTLGHNEMHGRLLQVQSLLEGVELLTGDDEARVSQAFLDLLPTFLPSQDSPRPQHPFAVLSSYLSISLRLPSTLSLTTDSPATLAATYLSASSTWASSAFHLPTADDFLRVCWKGVYAASATEPTQRRTLFLAGLAGRSLETKRTALEAIDTALESGEGDLVDGSVSAALLYVVLDDKEAGDVRVTAAELLRSSELTGAAKGHFEQLLQVYSSTPIVPLREAALPILASAVETDEQREKSLKVIDEASTADQSVEAREAAGLALVSLSRTFPSLSALPITQQASFSLTTLRMLQDDDITVRSYAHEAYGLKLVEGRAVETVLEQGGEELLAEVLRVQKGDLDADLSLLAKPSSLLFTVEKPNIFLDPLLVPSSLTSSSSSSVSTDRQAQLEQLEEAIQAGKTIEEGPLGRGGNEVVQKWEGVLKVAE